MHKFTETGVFGADGRPKYWLRCDYSQVSDTRKTELSPSAVNGARGSSEKASVDVVYQAGPLTMLECNWVFLV